MTPREFFCRHLRSHVQHQTGNMLLPPVQDRLMGATLLLAAVTEPAANFRWHDGQWARTGWLPILTTSHCNFCSTPKLAAMPATELIDRQEIRHSNQLANLAAPGLATPSLQDRVSMLSLTANNNVEIKGGSGLMMLIEVGT